MFSTIGTTESFIIPRKIPGCFTFTVGSLGIKVHNLLFRTSESFSKYSMSLSSTELNYLVYRYLQESGYDLAAYALEKQTKCLDYEHDKPLEILSKIDPGYLVNLVQKGILYSLTEAEVKDDKSELLTFFGSLLNEEKTKQKYNSLLEKIDDVDLKSDTHNDNNLETIQSKTFTTTSLTPAFEFTETSVCKWHPTADLLAYLLEDSSLLISALQNNAIVETASLRGPGLEKLNEISAMAWSPVGNLIITANITGDICCWAPDGNLRNIVKVNPLAIILEIQWSPNGQYFLTGDSNGKIGLWNGTNLSFIQEYNASGNWGFCWLDDHKFAISITSNIKIVSLDAEGNNTIGQLKGHEGPCSTIKFNNQLKLLLTYSNTDNLIKLWLLNSPNEESTFEDLLKIQPLITLEWLSSSNTNDFISLSINGVLRIWDKTKNAPVFSANIFKDTDYYKVDEGIDTPSGSLVYAADLSPSGDYIAIGDDSNHITVWDIAGIPYCKAIYKVQDCKGISSINWNYRGDIFTVSSVGKPSTMFNWK